MSLKPADGVKIVILVFNDEQNWNQVTSNIMNQLSSLSVMATSKFPWPFGH